MLQAFPEIGSMPLPAPPSPRPIPASESGKLSTLLGGYDPSQLRVNGTQGASMGRIGPRSAPQKAVVLIINDTHQNDRPDPRSTANGAPGAQPTRPSRTSIDTGIVALISDVVTEFHASDGSTSFWSMLQSALQEAGYTPSKALVDYYA